jgi:hypothetical protein
MLKYIIFGLVIILPILSIIIFLLIRSNKSKSTSPPPPTPTWYYPFKYDIKNYASGTGVTDAYMGFGKDSRGGQPIFSDGLKFTGSHIHNDTNALYVVLPMTYSGSIASFCCWFKSDSNPNDSRIIDMSTNRTFRLFITGDNTLNFNDEYEIKTNTNINNNSYNFIAINANGSNVSWVINDGGTGNSGSGLISTHVSLNSAGFLGHSFGNDPEFIGTLKEVRFFANQNLTSEQISTFYNESK